MLNVSRFVFLLFGFVLLAIAPQTWANVLEGVRVWPSPDETRVVLDVKSEVDYSYFTLSSPERLVVDLKQSTSRAKLPVNVTESGILSKVRASSPLKKVHFVWCLSSNKKPRQLYLNWLRHPVVNMAIV